MPTVAAKAGTLTVFVGGATTDVDRVAPVLSELGTVVRCGGSGTAAAAKLVVNTGLIAGLALLGELQSLGGVARRAGRAGQGHRRPLHRRTGGEGLQLVTEYRTGQVNSTQPRGLFRGGGQAMIRFHNPTTAPPPAAAYSNVAEIDLGNARLLILAGQVALDFDGQLVGGGDMRAQTRQVFDVIGALLADRGASFADVVNIRTYLADLDRLAEYGEVRRTYLTDPPPTSTTVEVSRLFRPGALLEVDITAVVRGTG